MSLGFQALMGNGWYDPNSGDLLGTVDPNQQAYSNFWAGQNTGMISAPQYVAPTPEWMPAPAPAPAPAYVAAPAPAPAPAGVNNYSYRYADGTTGNTPWKQDGNGNYLRNSSGGFLEEGTLQGRTMPDGSVNQATLGNVTADGRVNTYDGYSSSADQWFGGANANVFADRGATGANPAGQRAPDGFGYGAQATGAGAAPQTGGVMPAPSGARGGAQGGGAGQQPGYIPQTGGVMPAPGGAGGGAMSGQNPYLQQMGDVMAGQMTQNFNRNVMPGISSQMMATGGFGGSRQGVIEANAMNDLNGQIGNALTNLYGQGYNTSLNYDLGLRNNDLGFAGLDAQINQNNFNNRLNGANFGLGVYDRLQQGNQTGINAGTNIQNTPMNYWSQFANQFNGIGQGYGSTTGSTSQQGNPVLGALGGAQLGSRLMQGWGNSNAANNYQGSAGGLPGYEDFGRSTGGNGAWL